MITEAANAVSAQAEVVAKAANSATEKEQIAGLNKLTGACEKLEEAITGARATILKWHDSGARSGN